jgi:hypothetical protein
VSIVPTVGEQEVVTAVAGASAALAGLVLVFLGVLVSGYQTLLGRVSENVLDRFRTAAWLSLGVFALALASVALGIAWLDLDGGHRLYVAVVGLFFVELAALLVVAVYATWRVLLRS